MNLQKMLSKWIICVFLFAAARCVQVVTYLIFHIICGADNLTLFQSIVQNMLVLILCFPLDPKPDSLLALLNKYIFQTRLTRNDLKL